MIAAVEALVKAIGEQDHYHYWTGNKSDIMVTDTRTTKEVMRVIYTCRGNGPTILILKQSNTFITVYILILI